MTDKTNPENEGVARAVRVTGVMFPLRRGGDGARLSFEDQVIRLNLTLALLGGGGKLETSLLD